jgi:hypothetical protein
MRFLVVYSLLGALLFAQPETVPAGTRVEARLETAVETATSDLGDGVQAVFTSPLRSSGKIAVPEGSRLHGRIETIQAATRSNEGHVRLVFREMQLPDGRVVPVWITNSFGAAKPKRGLKYAILIGTGVVAGALIGGENARVAGILGGLLTGFVIASNTGDSKLPDVTLKAGRQIDLELREDLVVPK